MLRTLARRLGWARSERAPAWRRALDERGLDPLVLSSLAAFGELAAGWERCPRVDWAVDVARIARVEPALVTEGLEAIAREAAGWSAAPPFTEGRAAALRPDLGPSLLALVDAAPDVREALAALRSAERWKDRAKIQTNADAYDGVHAETHRRLAACFREHVTVEALRFALEGQRAHPYR